MGLVILGAVLSSQNKTSARNAGATRASTPDAVQTTPTVRATTTVRAATGVKTVRPKPVRPTTTPPPATTADRTTTAASGTQSTSAAAPPRSGRSSGACRSGDPLANVYHPYRLHIVRNCITVTGTVAYVRREHDGDIHVNLSLPPNESDLLDAANIADEYGNLVTEMIPADQPGCTRGRPPPLPPTAYRSYSYSYGVCTGADVATPVVGSQVAVTGPYVLDADHGWMEIHPVWSMTITGQTSPAPTSKVYSAPPSSSAAPTTA